MSSRKILQGSASAGLALLLLAVLVVLNYLSARHVSRRLDLTRNREFTVAPATRKLLAALDDVVTVKVYFSKDLPEQVASIPTRIRDLLAEFEAYGRGRLKIESVDPQANPEVEQKVRSLGIPRVPVMVLERNKQQQVDVYLGLTLSYADQTEVIPVVSSNTNLEYELASRILKMTRPKQTIAFLAGFDGPEPFRDYRTIAEQLRERYEVDSVDLAGDKMVPDKVATLIVAGPRKRLGDHARYALDQFVMRGGRALFLIDKFSIDLRSFAVSPIDTGLDDQLKSYGADVKPQLVEDWGMNELVQLPGGQEYGGVQMPIISEYPLWPKLIADNISETHATVNQLPSLVLPFTAPVEGVKDPDDAFEVTELFHSTQYARAEDHLVSAHPKALQQPREADLKRYCLGLAITGPQRSFFAGKTAPPADPKEASPDAAPEPVTEPAASGPTKDAVDSTQIVVVGGTDFASDSMLRQRAFAANAAFFLNAVDWLTMGDDLIGIRSRVGGEPLLDPKRREVGENVAPWINIVLVPLLVVALGLVWRATRNSRRVVLA
jgi:gliding-associated putative ABC transporter substrate-binding component GldG